MISVGGVVLPDSMIWTDRYIVDSIGQIRKRTLGGRQVVSSVELIAGVPITLSSVEDSGWVDKSTMDQILGLSEAVGMVYTFIFGGLNRLVIFRHDDPPAVEFKPLIPRVVEDPDDWFIGQIKLVTV